MSAASGLPLLWLAIDPKTAEDAQRLARALKQLSAEDTALHVRSDAATGQVVIGCAHEQHLETIVDRLKRDFEVNAAVGRPQVAYREALTRAAEGEAKNAKQTNGRGEYGHVKIHVSPGQPGSGYTFENHLIGGAIPDRFIDAVKEGIEDGLTRGVLGGYPIHDVRIDLEDGSYHDVDSTDAGFRTAGSLAAQAAARNADPVLLEPVMRVEVTVPTECESDVIVNLASRRGRVQWRKNRAETAIVGALVPLAELFSYATDLRIRTRGRGTCVMEFEDFMPLQPADDDDDRASSVRAPRKPAPIPMKRKWLSRSCPRSPTRSGVWRAFVPDRSAAPAS